MKRLFSVLMLAVVATLAFAFTTPKSAVLEGPYFFNGSSWVEGEGTDCDANGAPCQYETNIPITTPAQRLSAANQLSGSGTQTVTVDADNDGQVDDDVIVSNILRFR